MAASLLSRCLYRFRLSHPKINISLRPYSVDNDELSAKKAGTDSKVSTSVENNQSTNDDVNTPLIKKFTTRPKKITASEQALDKFAKVVEKVKAEQEKQVEPETDDNPHESFASMLRKSPLMALGDVTGRLVEGKVFEVMGDDLYIDFGGKFHCVCPRPKLNGEHYRRGTKVLLNLLSLEMSSAFLGSDIHITLLEADATLMGLSYSKKNRPRNVATLAGPS